MISPYYHHSFLLFTFRGMVRTYLMTPLSATVVAGRLHSVEPTVYTIGSYSVLYNIPIFNGVAS